MYIISFNINYYFYLGVLSESTENNYDEKEVTLESLSNVSKRQTNFQNDNLNQQQVKYFV